MPAIQCPLCKNQKTWKDGTRQTRNGDVQRYLCRECGYRFSETSSNQSDPPEHVERIHTDKSYSSYALTLGRQVGVAQPKGMKNLVKVMSRIQKQAAGATAKPSEADIKGKIVEVAWRLKKDGYSRSTIYNYPKYLKLLIKYGANLYYPESVKDVIATRETWGTSSKLMAVCAYTFFASLNGIPWKPPKYKPQRKMPFIPLESEIDALIASGGKKIATTLQVIKETGMRIGEVCRLRWIDVDLERNTIAVNAPEKGGNPRMFKISGKLAAMLNALPRKGERAFGKQKSNGISGHLCSLRKRVALKLQNPRLNHIHFHTLRHWKATMEYHKTRDILHVMKMLGHKSIENTLIYTQLIQFEGDEYHSAVAKTIDEAKALIETGFEYVCTHENLMLFRKRK
jgi:integrase